MKGRQGPSPTALVAAGLYKWATTSLYMCSISSANSHLLKVIAETDQTEGLTEESRHGIHPTAALESGPKFGSRSDLSPSPAADLSCDRGPITSSPFLATLPSLRDADDDGLVVVRHFALFYWHVSVGELEVNPIENQSALCLREEESSPCLLVVVLVGTDES